MSGSIDRRSVLKAGAVGIAFPSVIPSRILREPPSGILNIGIIGFGIRSKNLLYQFLNAPSCRVVGMSFLLEGGGQPLLFLYPSGRGG